MAYNEEIEGRIEEITGRWEDLDKKTMFGGICYLLKGSMCFGIWKDYLIVRTGPEAATRFLKEDGTRPFDITGRTMRGWVMVDASRWADTEDLARWLATGRDFALTLPAK